MRLVLRLLAMAGAAALVMFAWVPAAQAAGRTVTVDDFASFESSWACTADPPFGCSSSAERIMFQIHMSPSPSQAVTLGWQLEDITATAGQDYTGPTSGTVTFPANGYVTYVYVPLVKDAVAESNETFRFRITSSSVPATFTDTAIGTIKNGDQVPSDCTVTQTTYNDMFMTCSNRPPAQRWHLQAECAHFWAIIRNGNIVTGNGTSSVTNCAAYAYYPAFLIDP